MSFRANEGTLSSALRAVLLAALLLGLDGMARAAEPLRLAVSKTPLSLPIYIAQTFRLFEAEGLVVQVDDCVGGYRCMALMLDGKADLATASELPIMFSGFERRDFAVVATMVTGTDDVKLIAAPRAGVRGPQDLAGKRIGMVPRTSSQYFVELYLLAAGLDPKQLTLVALQPEQFVAALQSGSVDAVAAWEPFAFEVGRSLGRGAVVLPNIAAYHGTFNLVAARRLLDGRDAELRALLRAVDRAEQLIRQRPAEAQAVLTTRLQVDRPFVDWVWKGLSFRLALDRSLLTTLEGQARWARREGHASGGLPDYRALLHVAPLAAVAPAAVGTLR